MVTVLIFNSILAAVLGAVIVFLSSWAIKTAPRNVRRGVPAGADFLPVNETDPAIRYALQTG
jgi:hypothetical protein